MPILLFKQSDKRGRRPQVFPSVERVGETTNMSVPKSLLLCLLFLALGKASLGEEPQNSRCALVPTLLQAAGFAPSCVAAALAGCQDTTENHLPITQDLRDTLSEVRRAIGDLEKHRQRPRHCRDLRDGGDTVSGVRRVFPFRASPDVAADVYCDQETDGGGWTVFQRRLDLPTREDFYRTWVEYELGFGRMDGGEFWLGLDLLHHLTTHNLQELRVDLEDFEGNAAWAKYGFFHIGSAATNYRLEVGRYNGTAGDGFGHGRHNGHAFSTHNADHDGHETNCASVYRGGWWYDRCHISNLNGYQYKGKHDSYADGIGWEKWKGYHYSLKNTKMMIRPAF